MAPDHYGLRQLAELRAGQLGIPLDILVNAFLRNLGQTGEVHFSVADPMTPQSAGMLQEMREEVARGDTDGPFNIEEAVAFLDSIAHSIKIEYSKKFQKQYAKLSAKVREQFKEWQRLWLDARALFHFDYKRVTAVLDEGLAWVKKGDS